MNEHQHTYSNTVHSQIPLTIKKYKEEKINKKSLPNRIQQNDYKQHLKFYVASPKSYRVTNKNGNQKQ